MKRICLIGTGWLCVALGTLGIFLPLLPTTVFLLIAAWCFARSSSSFHNWLTSHPKLGPLINAWSSGQPIPKKTRNKILLSLWLCLAISAFIVQKPLVTAILIVIGLSVSIYILHRSRTSPTVVPVVPNNNPTINNTHENGE